MVDFSDGPLAASGLFAITGPTGAGKSTLLDAITLALFNKIPRFAPKGTEYLSKTEIDKAGSVITHHTDEAWAEVEYEAGNEAYRSTWKISRARTGNLKDYEMTLARLSDKHNMDLKKSEVPGENERILGLKYEQFIRSIVLAQGDFARLLKSDEKERARLLEDITGSHIYREIGKTIFERAREADAIINTLKQEAAGIPILSEEQLIEKKNARQHALTQTAELEAHIKKMNDTLVVLQRNKQLNQSLQELTEQLHEIREQKKASEGKFKALQLHTSLLPLKPNLALWKQAKSQLDVYEERIKNTTEEQSVTDTALQESVEALSAFTGFGVTNENFTEEAMRFRQEIHDMDRRLEGYTEEGNRLKKAMEDRMKGQHIASVVEIREETDRSIKLHIANQRLKALAENVARSNENIENILEKNKQSRQQLESLYQQANLVAQLEKVHQDIKKKQQQIEASEQMSIQKKAELEQAEKELAALQQEYNQLAAEKEQVFRQSSLDDLRSSLSEGEPCPLCGSIHHPFDHADFTSLVGTLEIRLRDAQRKLEGISTITQQLRTECAVLATTIQQLKETIQALENQSADLTDSIPSGGSSENLQASIKKLKDQIQARETEVTERTEFEVLSSLKEFLEKLLELQERYVEENNRRKSRYAGNDIEGDTGRKITVTRDLKSQSSNLRTRLETLTKELGNIRLHAGEMKAALRAGFLQAGIDSLEQGMASILDDAVAESWMNEKTALDRKEDELQTKLSHTRQDLASLPEIKNEEDVERLEGEVKKQVIHRDQLNHEIGAINNELHKNQEYLKAQAEKERQISEKIKENEALYNLNALIGDAQGVKYAKFAQNISLRALLRHANSRLTDITDRYRLVFTDIESDLMIEDLYQGNTRRSVKTLSGGETFMVSLAMALSLSDMASSHVQLESIFIDEGFGTLDMDTLEAAIITLEKLQAKSRKTIGIISHVPLLKERIHTQIVLKKNNLGYSEIEIRG